MILSESIGELAGLLAMVAPVLCIDIAYSAGSGSPKTSSGSARASRHTHCASLTPGCLQIRRMAVVQSLRS